MPLYRFQVFEEQCLNHGGRSFHPYHIEMQGRRCFLPQDIGASTRGPATVNMHVHDGLSQ